MRFGCPERCPYCGSSDIALIEARAEWTLLSICKCLKCKNQIGKVVIDADAGGEEKVGPRGLDRQ
jgi:hypothetical protein